MAVPFRKSEPVRILERGTDFWYGIFWYGTVLGTEFGPKSNLVRFVVRILIRKSRHFLIIFSHWNSVRKSVPERMFRTKNAYHLSNQLKSRTEIRTTYRTKLNFVPKIRTTYRSVSIRTAEGTAVHAVDSSNPDSWVWLISKHSFVCQFFKK